MAADSTSWNRGSWEMYQLNLLLTCFLVHPAWDKRCDEDR